MSTTSIVTPDDEGPKEKRGRRGEGTIYWVESKKSYRGEITVGYKPNGKRIKRTRYGKTIGEVQDKLRQAREEYEAGVKTSTRYTVGQCVDDFLKRGLVGRDEETIAKLKSLARNHVVPELGKAQLSKLTADEIDDWLASKAEKLATRSLGEILAVLRRSINHAQRRNRVMRNVAELVDVPEGQAGRPSRSLPIEDAAALLQASQGKPFHPYLVLSLLTGVRTEEARALTWQRVHLSPDGDVPPHVEVWRSVRKSGDTKTKRSRRSIALPTVVVDVLREHRRNQSVMRATAERWKDNDLVFCTRHGTALDAANVRRSFRATLKEAGLETTWTPRELRHSFVSLMSASGASIELIARLVGHTDTSTTETVYRHELRPVITGGAEIIDRLFGPLGQA